MNGAVCSISQLPSNSGRYILRMPIKTCDYQIKIMLLTGGCYVAPRVTHILHNERIPGDQFQPWDKFLGTEKEI